MTPRQLLRRVTPMAVRRAVALGARRAADRRAGLQFVAHTRGAATNLTEICAVEQPILDAPLADRKRHNLAKAAGLLDGLMMRPCDTFSLWAALGPPSRSRGWQAGRTIINGDVTADPGGGLCQVAGMIYHLGLLGGLTVIERHPHSRDLYAEDQRFTPLGLDAAIMFGFKDLRMRNDGAASVILRLGSDGRILRGALFGASGARACSLSLERVDSGESRQVTVTCTRPDGRIGSTSVDVYAI